MSPRPCGRRNQWIIDQAVVSYGTRYGGWPQPPSAGDEPPWLPFDPRPYVRRRPSNFNFGVGHTASIAFAEPSSETLRSTGPSPGGSIRMNSDQSDLRERTMLSTSASRAIRQSRRSTSHPVQVDSGPLRWRLRRRSTRQRQRAQPSGPPPAIRRPSRKLALPATPPPRAMHSVAWLLPNRGSFTNRPFVPRSGRTGAIHVPLRGRPRGCLSRIGPCQQSTKLTRISANQIRALSPPVCGVFVPRYEGIIAGAHPARQETMLSRTGQGN